MLVCLCRVNGSRMTLPELLKAIDSPVDRIKSLVLTSGLNDNICELVQGRFDLSDALVDVLQLRLHSEERCRSSDDKADCSQNVTVRDGAIEQRFWPIDLVLTCTHQSTF